jgi:hypothetical protein
VIVSAAAKVTINSLVAGTLDAVSLSAEATAASGADAAGILDAVSVSATAAAPNRAIIVGSLGALLSSSNAIILYDCNADANVTLDPLMATVVAMVHVQEIRAGRVLSGSGRSRVLGHDAPRTSRILGRDAQRKRISP